MKRLAAVIYHFLLEFNLGLLVIFFYFIKSSKIPPIVSLFFLCFTGLVPLVLLVQKYNEKAKWLYLVLILPIMFAAGTFVNFSIYSTGLIGLLIFWRGLSLYNDYSGHSDTLFIFLSFLIGILLIIYSSVLHYPYQILIVSLLILQIIFVLSGLFLSKWSSLGEDRLRFIAYFLKVIGAAAVVGSAITLILKYIQTILFGIFTALAWLLSFLSIPVLKILQFIINLFYQGERKPQNYKEGPGKFAGAYREHVSHNPNYFYWLIIITGIVVLIYYIKKRKVHVLSSGGYFSSLELNNDELRQERGLLLKKRLKPPADPIRREIFLLEKYAAKLGVGRLQYETLDEWWKRIELMDTSDINQIYSKIRYGMIHSTPKEQDYVKEIASTIKQNMKEVAKNRTQTKME